MLKDQQRRRRAHELDSYMDVLKTATPTPTHFLTPAEFYKSLFASAVLQQQQQQQQQHSDVCRFYPQTPSPISSVKDGAKSLSPSILPHPQLSSNFLFSAVCVAAVESAKRSQDKMEAGEQKRILKKILTADTSKHVSKEKSYK